MGWEWVGRVNLTRRLALSAAVRPCLLWLPLQSHLTLFSFCTLLFYIYLHDGLNNVCLSYQVRRLTRAGTVSVLLTNISLTLSNMPITQYMLNKYYERKEGIAHSVAGPCLALLNLCSDRQNIYIYNFTQTLRVKFQEPISNKYWMDVRIKAKLLF